MVTNKELLSIATDPLGRPGSLVHQLTNASDPHDPELTRTDNIVEQIWSRPLSGGLYALCFFNRGETTRPMTMQWQKARVCVGHRVMQVRDVWRGTVGAVKNWTSSVTGITAHLPRHTIALYTIKCDG